MGRVFDSTKSHEERSEVHEGFIIDFTKRYFFRPVPDLIPIPSLPHPDEKAEHSALFHQGEGEDTTISF
jgi:hypothetical protein